MECLRIDKIVCHATVGSPIDLCMRDGVLLAVRENRIVEFEHTGILVSLDPVVIIDDLVSSKWHEKRKG